MQKLALVGNPNTGKTTLFNSLTNLTEHVGNWHGVTVDYKEQQISYNNNKISVVDLPGTYSLNSFSFEEEVTQNYLKNNNTIILNVCDANNLKRNLYLTLELLASNYKPVVVLNMANELKKYETLIDINKLEQFLGVPIFLVNANNKKEVKKLLTSVLKLNANNFKNSNSINSLKLYEKSLQKSCLNNEDIQENKIQNRYQLIDEIFEKCINKSSKKVYGFGVLDKIVLNKHLAFPIFLFIMALTFFITFGPIGKFLSDIINSFIYKTVFNPVMALTESITASEFAINLIKDGVLGGVLSVVAFLPQVVLLFVCLNILEASGYLSRLAFVLEDVFAKVGLSGKSVFALLMGFGCSTTACLTSRGMDDKNSKIKTAMLTPYISCSAKLPLYLVVCGAYFQNISFFIIFLLYILGIIISLVVSFVLEKTILPSKTKSFIMEFPAFRKPQVKHLLKLALIDAKNFLIRVGTVILSFSCIIWIMQNCTFSLKYVGQSGSQSILQSVGKYLAFLFKPLGFGNYGAVCALICGVVAKEIIVSTLKIVNNLPDNSTSKELSKSFTNANSPVYFLPQSSLSFLVFSSTYLPCVSSIGVLKKEIGLKWTLFACVLEFAISYILAFVVYKIFDVYYNYGLITCLICGLCFAVFVICFVFIIKFFKSKNKCKYCIKNKSCKGCY